MLAFQPFYDFLLALQEQNQIKNLTSRYYKDGDIICCDATIAYSEEMLVIEMPTVEPRNILRNTVIEWEAVVRIDGQKATYHGNFSASVSLEHQYGPAFELISEAIGRFQANALPIEDVK